MQLLQIISRLNNSELSRLEAFVLENNRADANLLLAELKKYRTGKKTFDKLNVFKKVFGKKYTVKAEDDWKYKVRVLKELIYQFLAEEEFKLAYKNEEGLANVWVSKSLFRKRIDNLFEQEVDRYIKLEKDKAALKNILDLHKLKSMHAQRFTVKKSPLKPDEHLNLLKKIEELGIKYLLYELRSNEVGIAALMRRKLDLEDLKNSAATTLNLESLKLLNLESYEDDITQFYSYQKDSKLKRGEERIDALKNAFDLYKKLGAKLETTNEEGVILLANLSSAYFILGKYQEALDCLDKILIEEKTAKNIPYVYSSKIRMLIGLGKYQDAIDFFDKVEHVFGNKKYLFDAIAHTAYAHLFLYNSENCIRLISDKVSTNFITIKSHFRFAYIIAAIIEDDLNRAKREMFNFKNSSSLELTNKHKEVCSCYENYFKIWKGEVSNRKSSLKKLYNHLNALPIDYEIGILYFSWLKEHIAKELAL